MPWSGTAPRSATRACASGDATVRLWAVVRPPRNADLRAFLEGLSHDRFAQGIPDEGAR